MAFEGVKISKNRGFTQKSLQNLRRSLNIKIEIYNLKMEGAIIKYSIFAFTVLALCSVALLQAYPNEVKIKNNSWSKIIFYGYFVADKDLPPMARRSHRVLESQETGTFDGILLFDKMHSFEWEKITANKDKEFPGGMTGGQYPQLESLIFDKDYVGSIYLIYSDSGFKIMTQPESDACNQNTKSDL